MPLQSRTSPACTQRRYNSIQIMMIVFSYLGAVTILVLLVLFILFRTGVVVDESWFGLLNISSFTGGENWLVFFAVVDGLSFLLVTAFWVAYYYMRLERCEETKIIRITGGGKLYQTVLILLTLFGVAVCIGFVFMIIYFLGERAGFAPWLSVNLMEGVTNGENWTLFLFTIFLAFYFSLLTFWLAYKYFHGKGEDFDDSLEGLPTKFGE